MPFSLGGALVGVTTSNSYTSVATLGPISLLASMQFIVSGASVFVEIAKINNDGSIYFDTVEVPFPPGQWGYTEIYGIRFRSAKAGVPATVIATGYFEGDAVPFGNTAPESNSIAPDGTVTPLGAQSYVNSFANNVVTGIIPTVVGTYLLPLSITLPAASTKRNAVINFDAFFSSTDTVQGHGSTPWILIDTTQIGGPAQTNYKNSDGYASQWITAMVVAIPDDNLPHTVAISIVAQGSVQSITYGGGLHSIITTPV